MEITEVRVKLMDRAEDRLRAFCSITFDDCFVIRDLKIIEGNSGPFVAMPSRKLSSHCPNCRQKNHLRAKYCNNCGRKLASDSVPHDPSGRAKLYADIAHPVNSSCREIIQSVVVSEFENELERAKSPDYVSRYDDAYDIVERESGYHATVNVGQTDAAETDTAETDTAETDAGQTLTPESNLDETGDASDAGDLRPEAAEPRTNPPHRDLGESRDAELETGSRTRENDVDGFGEGIFDKS